MNVADTVQFALIAPVVYVVPESEPLQPVTVAVYSAAGITVNVVVNPAITVLVAGSIVPFDPPVAVTVNVSAGVKLNVAVQVVSLVKVTIPPGQFALQPIKVESPEGVSVTLKEVQEEGI